MKFKLSGIFWGLIIIAIAVSIILSNLGFVTAGIYTIIMTAIFAAIAIKSIAELNFTGTLFGAGHIIHLMNNEFGFLPRSFEGWSLILAATLLGIGLDIIFKSARKNLKRKRKEKKMGNGHGVYINIGGDDDNDNVVYESEARDSESSSTAGSFSAENGNIVIDNAFGENSRYITDQNFVNAQIDNGFGTLNVYFENVQMLSSQASMSIDNGFGKVNVYLPANWRVNLKEDAGFGKIKLHGTPSTNPENPIININAETGFGDVNIYFG